MAEVYYKYKDWMGISRETRDLETAIEASLEPMFLGEDFLTLKKSFVNLVAGLELKCVISLEEMSIEVEELYA